MTLSDVRWEQRLDNYSRALAQLQAAVELGQSRPLSELEQLGLIQAFEFKHELAWKVMKHYFFYQGNSTITGSRDASCIAFAMGLVTDGEGWMEMIQSRNQSSHTYNRVTAQTLVDHIMQRYAKLFGDFFVKMQELRSA